MPWCILDSRNLAHILSCISVLTTHTRQQDVDILVPVTCESASAVGNLFAFGMELLSNPGAVNFDVEARSEHAASEMIPGNQQHIEQTERLAKIKGQN